MRENITGDLLDISVLNELPDALDVYSVGNSIIEKYNQLWNEISETTTIRKSENYKIQERIRKLKSPFSGIKRLKQLRRLTKKAKLM